MKIKFQPSTLASLFALALVVAFSPLAVAAQQSAVGSTRTAAQNEPVAPKPQTEAEPKLSPQEAQELFRSVDEILEFVSRDTGLPIKTPVKRKLASREEVQKFIQERMKDDEDRRRLERSEVVLKKFALLPRNFDLSTFLVDLLKEQVAGFYNTKDKTVYLLDWVAPEAQKPVLAHELTHALQDQNFGLDQWMKSARRGKEDSAEQLMEDERIAARQAVSEGQAMVSLIDYMLKPTGQSLESSPNIADAVMAGMMTSGQTPLYTKAPMFLRQLLVFPYQYGLRFERDVLVAKGIQGAFSGTFQRPPSDTHEVMDPQSYLQGKSITPMPVPAFENAAGKQYEKYDISVVGEFDVWLLAKQYQGQAAADGISPKWRGGYYYAALKPGTAKLRDGSATVADSSVALAYVSRWESPKAASQFAAIYADYLPKRYAGVKEAAGDAGWRAPQTSQRDMQQLGAHVTVNVAGELTGIHRWNSDAGPITIEVRGDEVLILEGFDDVAAARLRGAVFGK